MGAPKKSQEMCNYVVMKATNVHQVKVNEHDGSEWNKRSRSFSGLLHRVSTFAISFNFIHYSSNKAFLKCKIFLLIYAMYNVMIC